MWAIIIQLFVISIIRLATSKKFKTEILSCDSRQFYNEIPIGTGVPSKEELSEIRHHFIQHKSIKDTYTVGDFEKGSTDTDYPQ